MKYLSVCSGVEAATLAWKDIGWEAGAFSEIEPFPSEVLKYHYPQVCNLGDMTKIKKEDIHGKYDLLVGGTPCQSFSTAGTRTGLNGLSGLALEYVRLAYEGGFRWIVWENVQGVFSCNGGRDFQTFLSELAGRAIPLPTGGWKSAGIVKTNRKDRFGLAWRVLDAQFTRTPNFPFALPQRRRRVFVIGYFGDWRPAVQVLFDPKGMCWNAPQRVRIGETAESIADSIGVADSTLRPTAIHLAGGQTNQLATPDLEVAKTLSRNNGGISYIAQTSAFLGSQGKSFSMDYTKEISPTIRASSPVNVLVHSGGGVNAEVTINYAPTLCRHAGIVPMRICYENHPNDSRLKESKDVSPQLTARYGTGGGNLPLIQEKTIKYNIVRQLTPIECERLMGFPDNYTQIPWKGKPAEQCPDSLRYKVCGNSMCVNVMEWIGIRIDMVDKLLQK